MTALGVRVRYVWNPGGVADQRFGEPFTPDRVNYVFTKPDGVKSDTFKSRSKALIFRPGTRKVISRGRQMNGR